MITTAVYLASTYLVGAYITWMIGLYRDKLAMKKDHYHRSMMGDWSIVCVFWPLALPGIVLISATAKVATLLGKANEKIIERLLSFRKD